MAVDPATEHLSLRETEIAEAFASGASYREIASRLGIAPATVRTHLGTVYRKLGVSSKIALLRRLQSASIEVGHPDDPAAAPQTPFAPVAPGGGDVADGIDLPPRPVIAVLPFTNMSGDATQEYFADGITEDIITRLSYLRGVSVISRTSTFVFKNSRSTVREISAELGARFILEGSVRTAGRRVRVVAQLIDSETSEHLWSERYERELEDIFDLQDEITHAIVIALQIVLSEGDLILDPGGTENYDAWVAYQQGARAHMKYTAEDNLRARRLYEKALDHDPHFLDARVYRAWTFWQHARSGFAVDRDAELAVCRRIMDELLAAGLVTANVRHLECCLLLLERRYDEALDAARQAIAMGPSKLAGYTPAAIANLYSGNYQTAADVLWETVRTIPSTPTDSIYNLAVVLSLMGEDARAIALAEEYMRRVPDDLFAYTTLATNLGRAGDRERATQTIAAFRVRFPLYRIADFRAHEPFRDERVLEETLAVLRAAGLPD